MNTLTVLDVGVTVDRIECARLSEMATQDSKSTYTLNVGLLEKERGPAGLTINFNLELVGSPQLAKLVVSGSARLIGSENDIREALSQESEKSPPKVVETIYEKLYGLLYVLTVSMKVPFPQPNLLKKSPQAKAR